MQFFFILKRCANWTCQRLNGSLTPQFTGAGYPPNGRGDNFLTSELPGWLIICTSGQQVNNYRRADKRQVSPSKRISSKSKLDWNTKDFSSSNENEKKRQSHNLPGKIVPFCTQIGPMKVTICLTKTVIENYTQTQIQITSALTSYTGQLLTLDWFCLDFFN